MDYFTECAKACALLTHKATSVAGTLLEECICRIGQGIRNLVVSEPFQDPWKDVFGVDYFNSYSVRRINWSSLNSQRTGIADCISSYELRKFQSQLLTFLSRSTELQSTLCKNTKPLIQISSSKWFRHRHCT